MLILFHHICILFFLQYTFVLIIVFLLEAVIGGLAFVYENHIGEELSQTLNETFVNGYGIDQRQTAAIDRMQQEVNTTDFPIYYK